MNKRSTRSASRESVLEQITNDCAHLFGARGHLTRSLCKRLRTVWIQYSPEKAVRRFPQWKGTVNHAAKYIARHYLREETLEKATEYLSQEIFLFRFWAAEVYEGFQRISDAPLDTVFDSAKYGQLIRIIDMIGDARSNSDFDEEKQEIADAGMFFANLAWFHFLWKRLFDATDRELQKLVSIPIKGMHEALKGGRNLRTTYPHALQYPDARDMLLIIEWLTRNRFESFDQEGLDWQDDGPFNHTLSLDRWVYQQWIELAYDEIPDELMLKTLRQFQSGPILHLAINHARISLLCKRLGRKEEAQRDLAKARALFALSDDVSIKERVHALCWFARANIEGDDFVRALEMALKAPEEKQESSRHWFPLVLVALETNRWPALKSQLQGTGAARKMAKNMDPFFMNLVIPKSIWTTQNSLVESRQKEWREFLEPHRIEPTPSEGIKLEFEQLLERGDWRAASEICIDAQGPYQGPRAVVKCCVENESLEAAIEWAEQIEDFEERQLAKLAAVSTGLDELDAAYLDVPFLSFATLGWPAFGC